MGILISQDQSLSFSSSPQSFVFNYINPLQIHCQGSDGTQFCTACGSFELAKHNDGIVSSHKFFAMLTFLCLYDQVLYTVSVFLEQINS